LGLRLFKIWALVIGLKILPRKSTKKFQAHWAALIRPVTKIWSEKSEKLMSIEIHLVLAATKPMYVTGTIEDNFILFCNLLKGHNSVVFAVYILTFLIRGTDVVIKKNIFAKKFGEFFLFKILQDFSQFGS
jgi:hypothetical protein